MVNGPPGTSTSPGEPGWRPAAVAAAPCSGGAGPAQLVGGEHGLVVLLLVLRDHAEREAAAE